MSIIHTIDNIKNFIEQINPQLKDAKKDFKKISKSKRPSQKQLDSLRKILDEIIIKAEYQGFDDFWISIKKIENRLSQWIAEGSKKEVLKSIYQDFLKLSARQTERKETLQIVLTDGEFNEVFEKSDYDSVKKFFDALKGKFDLMKSAVSEVGEGKSGEKLLQFLEDLNITSEFLKCNWLDGLFTEQKMIIKNIISSKEKPTPEQMHSINFALTKLEKLLQREEEALNKLTSGKVPQTSELIQKEEEPQAETIITETEKYKEKMDEFLNKAKALLEALDKCLFKIKDYDFDSKTIDLYINSLDEFERLLQNNQLEDGVRYVKEQRTVLYFAQKNEELLNEKALEYLSTSLEKLLKFISKYVAVSPSEIISQEGIKAKTIRRKRIYVKKDFEPPIYKVGVQEFSELDDLAIRISENRMDFLDIKETYKDVSQKLKSGEIIDANETKKVVDFFNHIEGSIIKLNNLANESEYRVYGIKVMPVKSLFEMLPEYVDEIARKFDKKVKITFFGEGTPFDMDLLHVVIEPLLQLIKNSIKHGIENPDDRIKAKKPPRGEIMVSAHLEGNLFVVSVEDDGRGFNIDSLIKQGIKKGLISESDIEFIHPDEVINMIFKSGFSSVMIRKEIEKLGGFIQTKSGKFGSSISIRIPFNSIFVQSLIVNSENKVFCFPMDSIIGDIKINLSEIKTIEQNMVMDYKDRIISLLKLSDILSLEKQIEDNEMTAIILKIEGRPFGVLVNSILGHQNIFVKKLQVDESEKLPEYVDVRKGICGVSKLSDGKKTYSINIPTLVNYSVLQEREHKKKIRLRS
jgi:two-component system chemotaxis sensor kinase CheA